MKMNVLYITVFLATVVVVGLLLLYFAKMRLRFEQRMVRLPKVSDVPVERWSKLAEEKIFFGHQSVGYNIIDGIEDIIHQGGPVKLNIIEMSSSLDFEKPCLTHVQVGQNTQPLSKIESFLDILKNGSGEKLDIAFLKFCYVDITHDSNHLEIFEKYKAAINDMERQYPRVKFLHFTVPLTSPVKNAKSSVKGFTKWLLMKPTAIDDNLKREQYNKLVRDTYGKTGRVFDLTFIESVGPGGLPRYVDRGGLRIPFMAPEYTDDGGHLNEKGRKAVAEQLLIKLSEVAAQNP
jgi:hypothetical protein